MRLTLIVRARISRLRRDRRCSRVTGASGLLASAGARASWPSVCSSTSSSQPTSSSTSGSLSTSSLFLMSMRCSLLAYAFAFVKTSSGRRTGQLGPRGQTCFDRFEPLHQLPGEASGAGDVAGHHPSARAVLGAIFCGVLEVFENAPEHPLELFDVAPNEE